MINVLIGVDIYLPQTIMKSATSPLTYSNPDHVKILKNTLQNLGLLIDSANKKLPTDALNQRSYLTHMYTYVAVEYVAIAMIEKSMRSPKEIAEIEELVTELEKLKKIKDVYYSPNKPINPKSKFYNRIQEITEKLKSTVTKMSPRFLGHALLPQLPEVIEVISQLLTLKAFLPSASHNKLYRFIQLYPIFMIIDNIEEYDKTYEILHEMQQLSWQLASNFTEKNDSTQSFNDLSALIDESALTISLKSFAQSMTLLSMIM